MTFLKNSTAITEVSNLKSLTILNIGLNHISWWLFLLLTNNRKGRERLIIIALLPYSLGFALGLTLPYHAAHKLFFLLNWYIFLLSKISIILIKMAK